MPFTPSNAMPNAMPEALKVDWETIRKDRASNFLSYDKLSEKYGLKAGTIAQHAKRHGWDTVPARTRRLAQNEIRHAVKAHVATAMQEIKPAVDAAVNKWTANSHRVAGLAMEQVRDKLEKPLEVEELLKVTSALDKADLVGRRALGMDKELNAQNPNARPNISINLGVGLVDTGGRPSVGLPVDYGSAIASQVIDVQAVDEPVK